MDKKCFIICPIGKEKSDIRKWSDKVFDEILYPVLSKYDYFPFRSDHIHRTGIIHNQIIDAIIDSQLVIADLTYHNPNVFYELSLRHAIAKPFLQIISKKDPIPFDIGPIRTLELDFEDLESTLKKFEKMVNEAADENKVWENPISMALNTRNIRLNPAFDENDISINFIGSGLPEIYLPTINSNNLPSEQARSRLNLLIEKHKLELENRPKEENITPIEISGLSDLIRGFDFRIPSIPDIYDSSHKIPEENLSLEALEEKLENVENDYLDQNYFELFENRSHKINFEISNISNGHLEDVDIFLRFPIIDEFIIGHKIFTDPRKSTFKILPIYDRFSPRYPDVRDNGSMTEVFCHINKIKHYQLTKMFGLDLRIVIALNISCDSIPIECELHAKNLVKPIKKELIIKIFN